MGSAVVLVGVLMALMSSCCAYDFYFNRSGPFYFISGAAGHCAHGQKLIVVVLATRNPIPSPPPAPAERPYWPPPTPSLSPYPSPASAPSTLGHPPSTPLPPRPSSSASDLAVSKVSLGLSLLMALGRVLG
ncbi:hypothetical protein C4D60_Mb06t15290 [Musa balbisiana]|uniref:Phytocyanin domain-containing protein n=1 Tax=Musa balbisiana TaxID=52838 RepID=A0A4S8IQP6_MUSBA|nr:hypothetical protein C4D60_Mb06t15290 [Musa balbisiana]